MPQIPLIPPCIDKLLKGEEIRISMDRVPDNWKENPNIEFDGLKCIINRVEGEMVRHVTDWYAIIKAYPNQTYEVILH